MCEKYGILRANWSIIPLVKRRKLERRERELQTDSGRTSSLSPVPLVRARTELTGASGSAWVSLQLSGIEMKYENGLFFKREKLKESQGWVSILLFNWDWASTWKGFFLLGLCERPVRNTSLLKRSPGLENWKQRRKERRSPLALVHSQVLRVAMALNKIENDRDRQELGREGESAGTTNEEK